MANIHRAPRQWCLTKHETVNTFENWKQNLIYTLSLDVNFADFIATDAQSQKKTAVGNNGATTQQRVYMLELILGQIANYCPVISRNTIVKNSTSLSVIWQTIRLHYGFQSTGSHFIDFVTYCTYLLQLQIQLELLAKQLRRKSLVHALHGTVYNSWHATIQ